MFPLSCILPFLHFLLGKVTRSSMSKCWLPSFDISGSRSRHCHRCDEKNKTRHLFSCSRIRVFHHIHFNVWQRYRNIKAALRIDIVIKAITTNGCCFYLRWSSLSKEKSVFSCFYVITVVSLRSMNSFDRFISYIIQKCKRKFNTKVSGVCENIIKDTRGLNTLTKKIQWGLSIPRKIPGIWRYWESDDTVKDRGLLNIPSDIPTFWHDLEK